MKYFLPGLLLVLAGLLTACAGNPANPQQPRPVSANTLDASAGISADSGVMDNFINAVNNGQMEEALDLFTDSSVFIEVDQIGLLTNLPQSGGNYTYTGRAGIRDWLQYELEANLNIKPLNYAENGPVISLEASFYYLNQVIDARLDARTQAGRFNSVTYYIQKVNYLSTDN
jgi:hypothetical protein